jgi:hypothetical protein
VPRVLGVLLHYKWAKIEKLWQKSLREAAMFTEPFPHPLPFSPKRRDVISYILVVFTLPLLFKGRAGKG